MAGGEDGLRRTAGPGLLWALGVAYVISGDFFGWNFGLRDGGWSAMFVATAAMAVLYGALVACIAELAAATPVAGGAFAFARRAFGPLGGYLTGIAVAIEYTFAPAVIAVGLGGYLAGWLGDPGGVVSTWTPVVGYVACVAINLAGAAVSLRALLLVTVLAAAALLAWAAAMVVALPPGGFAPLGAAVSQLPSIAAVAAALPAAGWFFLAVEGVPMAAEETHDPARDLPRGMAAAMITLVALALLVLTLAPLGGGVQAIAQAGNPLPQALAALGQRGAWFTLVSAVGLVGLFASMLSIVYADSRHLFALARAGHLPPWLARTDRRGVPRTALLASAAAGLAALVLAGPLAPAGVAPADLLMQVAVFAALASYVAIAASHLRLRAQAPSLPRPYRTPGGPLLPLLVMGLALAGGLAGAWSVPAAGRALAILGGLLAVAAIDFVWIVRRRLAGRTLEQELAIVRAAELGADVTSPAADR